MRGIAIRIGFFKAPVFCRRFLTAIPLFFVFFTAPFLGKANEEPDEISVFLSLQKTGTYIPALLQEETLFLPVREVFNFLKINNQGSVDSISGFIIDTK